MKPGTGGQPALFRRGVGEPGRPTDLSNEGGAKDPSRQRPGPPSSRQGRKRPRPKRQAAPFQLEGRRCRPRRRMVNSGASTRKQPASVARRVLISPSRRCSSSPRPDPDGAPRRHAGIEPTRDEPGGGFLRPPLPTSPQVEHPPRGPMPGAPQCGVAWPAGQNEVLDAMSAACAGRNLVVDMNVGGPDRRRLPRWIGVPSEVRWPAACRRADGMAAPLKTNLMEFGGLQIYVRIVPVRGTFRPGERTFQCRISMPAPPLAAP